MRKPWKNRPQPDNAPSEKEAPDEVITREFTGVGSLLQLQSMDADTVIQTGGETLSVTVTGRQSKLDKLVIDETNGLSITSQRPKINISLTINGKSIWRLLFELFFTTKTVEQVINCEDKHKLKIVATVPAGTDLLLTDYDGSLEANGVYGEVNARVSYDTTLRLDRLTTLDVNSDSGLDLTVQNMEGNAHINTSYDSKVKILGGVIGECDVRTDSGADVLIKARCSEVTAKGSYDCTFRFGTITRLKVDADSGARIYFDCDEANQVEIETSYDSVVTGTGKTRRAIVRTDSGCSVTLGEVTDRFEARCSYDCKVVTTAGEGTRYVMVHMDSGADVQLIGHIREGLITTSYDSSVLVGILGSGVRTNFDGETNLSTGYMSVN
jgi:hypothetical protein